MENTITTKDVENIKRIEKQYEENLINNGCGYWSVCFEHGFACPCSPSSKVMQGFNIDTWRSLQKENG